MNVPPIVPITPRRTKNQPSLARSEAMRMSQ
jgi:hypothetical protein